MQRILGKSLFRLILQKYFKEFSFQSVKYEDFVDTISNFVVENFSPFMSDLILHKMKMKKWINSSGLPLKILVISTNHH